MPSRKELFLDYGQYVSHSVTRVRLARPDLYARFLELEQLARTTAQQRITELVQANAGAEHKVSAEIQAIAQEYSIGLHTLCSWRKAARNGKNERPAWDWPRIMQWLRSAIKAKDKRLTSFAALARLIGPEYHIAGTGNTPQPVMSKHTIYGHLAQDEALHEKFLALCFQNRKRANKEVK